MSAARGKERASRYASYRNIRQINSGFQQKGVERKERTGSGACAYLTVYAALSMAVLLSLFFAVLEGIRQNTVFLEAKLIADIGLDSLLAEYHRELLEQYDLFMIDTSYGCGQPSKEAVEAHLLDYVTKNCAQEEVFLGDWLYRDFLALEPVAVRLLRSAAATDQEGRIFRSRAAEAVRDETGLTYLQELAGWLDVVEKNGLASRDPEREKEILDEQIQSYQGSEREVEGRWVIIEMEDVTEPLEEQKRKGILNLVLEDLSSLSAVGVDVGTLISSRRCWRQMNQGNWEILEEEPLTDKLLFQEYVAGHCGNYRKPLEKGLLRYQLEYVIAGKSNDLENLKSVVYRLSALRETANAIYLFSDAAKCAQAETAALLAASLMLVPEAAPLIQASILLGWAYAESLYDVKCLLAGGRVPLLKTQEDWHYDIGCVLEGILDPEGTGSAGDKKGGLGYEEYLRILLALTPLEDRTFRMMDIVEMDIRQTPGNQHFRLDGCIDRLEAEVEIRSAYGYSTVLTWQKKY